MLNPKSSICTSTAKNGLEKAPRACSSSCSWTGSSCRWQVGHPAQELSCMQLSRSLFLSTWLMCSLRVSRVTAQSKRHELPIVAALLGCNLLFNSASSGPPLMETQAPGSPGRCCRAGRWGCRAGCAQSAGGQCWSTTLGSRCWCCWACCCWPATPDGPMPSGCCITALTSRNASASVQQPPACHTFRV